MTTFSDIDVDAMANQAALAHFGVLGMKWGKRSASSGGVAGPTGRSSTAAVAKPDHSVRNKRIATGIGLGVAAVGLAAAGVALQRSGKLNVLSTAVKRKASSVAEKRVENLLSRIGRKPPPPPDFQKMLKDFGVFNKTGPNPAWQARGPGWSAQGGTPGTGPAHPSPMWGPNRRQFVAGPAPRRPARRVFQAGPSRRY